MVFSVLKLSVTPTGERINLMISLFTDTIIKGKLTKHIYSIYNTHILFSIICTQ